MKEERNIITMDGQGNIFLPSDIGATAMTEREICELFGVIAPTVRAGMPESRVQTQLSLSIPRTRTSTL